jgi:hypothetical protein
VGAVVPVVVIVLFVTFGADFDDDALSGLRIERWAVAITGAEVPLLGLLSCLALAARDLRHDVTG